MADAEGKDLGKKQRHAGPPKKKKKGEHVSMGFSCRKEEKGGGNE